MANTSKQKGTRAETAVVKYLMTWGIEAERKALAGSEDKGDVKVSIGSGITLEVKAGKMTANPNRSQLTEWYRQAKAEGEHSNQPFALCVVRYRRALKDADVYFQWREMKAHMYLDEFCLFIKEHCYLF